MKKFLLAFFALTVFAHAQAPPTSEVMYQNGGVPFNTFYKLCGVATGYPYFCGSKLTDDGTQLLYNGLPVGGGGGGSATVAGAAPVFTCSGVNTISCSLTSAPAGSVLANAAGTSGAPAYTTTPVLNGSAITNIQVSSLVGTLSVAQLPPTVAIVAGTPSANTIGKYVTGNSIGPSSLSDNGTTVSTTETVTAQSFTGAATGLTAFPISQFSSAGRVAPVTIPGLVGEYHHNEASGATTGIDYSGVGNNGTYFGTPTLAGTLAGGMTSAGAGGMDYPTSFNTALTFSFYTCTSAQNTNSATIFPLAIGGITVAGTAPTTSHLAAFGLMTLAVQTAPALSGALIGRYNYSPSTYTDSTSATESQEGLDGCHLVTLVRDPTTDHLYIDGKEVTHYRVQGGSSTLVPVSGSMAVGMPHYATLPQVAFGFPYPIYYSAVFSGALTATQISNLSGSVQSYMQLRGVIKPPSTFSDAGNQLIFLGDSITYGVQPTPWVRLITTTTPYIPITGTTGAENNLGTPSWKISDLIQECENRGYGSLNPNSATTAVIWVGTNSLANATQISPATAYGELRRLVQCYKRRVPRVIVTTMISRTANGFGGTALDTLKNQLNDQIRKDNAGADGTWDIASFSGFGADGAFGNPTNLCNGGGCFAIDGVHPSATPNGENQVATLFSNYINTIDAIKNWTNPILVTAATATILPEQVAVNANPSTNAQTLTLPDAQALVGTERYVSNIQTTGTNTVTIQAITGQVIDAANSMVCPNATLCTFRAVLGFTKGLATGQADILSGAHWEQTTGQGGSGGGTGGDATSLWHFPLSATAITSGQVVGYNGTNIVGVTVPSGSTVPTGTGFRHVTAGAEDPASRAVALASADVSGVLPAANLPVATTSALGLVQCDGTTTACSGAGVISVIGSGGGGASLAANTFTGQQTMPSLQDTPIADTGAVNAAVVANTAVTALTAGTIITFNPVAANTIVAPTLNVNALGAKTITKLGGAALGTNDLIIGTTAVVLYNTGGSGTWQLLNPAGGASLNVSQSFQGTQTFSTLNFTTVLQKGGQGVFPATRCIVTTSAATTANCSATGTTTTGVCVAFPANAIAVTLNTTNAPFITVPTTNLPTLTFASAATAGAIYNVLCTPN